jgi:hypothetical protein
MKTRDEVEKRSQSLGDRRWNVWVNCGVHEMRALPEAESGEHYCPICWTLYKTITPVGSPRVRTFGNTASSSRYDLNLQSGPTDNTTPYMIQYLTVWANENGTWRIVSQQTTAVPRRP